MFPKTTTTTIIALLAAAGLVSAAPTTHLAPRNSGDLTFYDPGMGACGISSGAGEMVVALNAPQFDPATPNGNPNLNSLCGKRVRVTGPSGTTVDATIVDRCPGCAAGSLDLSPAAFQVLAPLDKGRVAGTWEYIS